MDLAQEIGQLDKEVGSETLIYWSLGLEPAQNARLRASGRSTHPLGTSTRIALAGLSPYFEAASDFVRT